MAFTIDILLILVPGFIWMMVFGKVFGFMIDPPEAARFRILCLAIVICSGILYLLTYAIIQVLLIRKQALTIGKKLMGFK